MDFTAIQSRMKEILYGYVKCPTFTGTAAERKAEDFLKELITGIPYFAKHPELWGFFPVEGDGLGRNVFWAMVRGSGPRTVVLLHHYDVVDIEDYKTLKDLAFSPEELHEALKKQPQLLSEEAQADLQSGAFLFCHGACDMKAGGATQLALLEQYSQEGDFPGNVIVLAVPDEENLSAGMRSAVKLLAQLKKRFDLEYVMTINSEPHQRKTPDKGVFSEGTVGKLMPFVYVRGSMSHAGKVFEGFNPAGLLGEIVTKTEINMDFVDADGLEASPPPTWLSMKDSKTHYDVSMPQSAYGCFSVLTLRQTPEDVLYKVRKICEGAFADVISRMNDRYRAFCKMRRQEGGILPWRVKVIDFKTLYDEAKAAGGETFLHAYQKVHGEVLADLGSGTINMIEGNERLLTTTCGFVEDTGPYIVYGLLPPYYPAGCNERFASSGTLDLKAAELCKKLMVFTEERFGQTYEKENYFTGICDLSYINIEKPGVHRQSMERAMPLWGDYYNIPFEEIGEIAMAGINIGPWGKDFHKLSERVLLEDLYERTPRILDYAVRVLLG